MTTRPTAKQLLDHALASGNHQLAAMLITAGSLEYIELVRSTAPQAQPSDLYAALSRALSGHTTAIPIPVTNE